MRQPSSHISISKQAALRSGVLPEDEESELRAHLAACKECRSLYEERFEELSSEAEKSGAETGLHIPDGLLTRWDAACRELVGLERLLVRRHLQECADCAEALRFLGYEPVLPIRPELDLATSPLAAAEPSGNRIDDTGLRKGGAHWRDRISGMRLALIPTLQLVAVRSGGQLILEARRETRALALAFTLPPEIQPASTIEVTLAMQSGQPILNGSWPAAELALRGMIFLTHEQEFTPGFYTLTLRVRQKPEMLLSYQFELRIVDH